MKPQRVARVAARALAIGGRRWTDEIAVSLVRALPRSSRAGRIRPIGDGLLLRERTTPSAACPRRTNGAAALRIRRDQEMGAERLSAVRSEKHVSASIQRCGHSAPVASIPCIRIARAAARARLPPGTRTISGSTIHARCADRSIGTRSVPTSRWRRNHNPAKRTAPRSTAAPGIGRHSVTEQTLARPAR